MSLPPSSPRLPSPPPPTEIQIGPKSPSLGDLSRGQEAAIEQVIMDANAARRIHPGTKSSDMAAGPPLVPLMELDSAFQLQEHLKALHFHHTKPSNAMHSIPISRSTAAIIANPPNGVDRALWLYELCRFLINKCNDIIVRFLFDSPPCSSVTCPEMRASEWQFLCAVHESPKSCCAIDYCCHTLDWATNIVTSQKIFPSRLSLGTGDSMDERGSGVKHLVNIFRRLHRIFAHAWFQHREVFWRVESRTGLYVLFKTVCDNYELLPAENYKLPPEAEGLEPIPDTKPVHTILRPDFLSANNAENKPEDDDPSITASNRTNTHRHSRSSPSTGSAVQTVLEADEDDSDVTQKLVEMHIAEDETEQGTKEDKMTDEETKIEILVEPELKLETHDEAKAEAEAEVEVDVRDEASSIPNEVEIAEDPSKVEEPEKHPIQVASSEESPHEEETAATAPVNVESSETAEEKVDAAENKPVQAVE